MTTVFYERADRAAVTYTIVDGEPLESLEPAEVRDVRGVPVAMRTVDDMVIATWTRDGHTCIVTVPRGVAAGDFLQRAVA